MAMLLHAGGTNITRQELDLIPLPTETDTYKPVPHFDLVNRIHTISQDLIKNFTLRTERYAVARDGQRMFGYFSFKNCADDMGMALGFRNSYDKSMVLGFAIGADVFVCDNLALTGDITVMRKHTKNVWEDFEMSLITTIYKSKHNYLKLVADAARMRGIEFSDTQAWQALGQLFGEEIISPRQIVVARDQWLKPSHAEFRPRTMWSFYNACTEALKSCPPTAIMEKHIELHKTVTGIWE